MARLINETGKRYLLGLLDAQHSKDLGDSQNITRACYETARNIIEKLRFFPDSLSSGKRHISIEYGAGDEGESIEIMVYDDRIQVCEKMVRQLGKKKELKERNYKIATTNTSAVPYKIADFLERSDEDDD